MKRLFDIVVCLLLLIVAAPVFMLAALTIKLFSRGGVLFTQERIGYQGKPFRIFKFRTMHENTSQKHTGTVTVKDDPRFFPGSRTLRKFKIDELPQIFNVLNGSMSLVGPRPTVAEDYDRMDERQRGRFEVLPGLTGLAQINGNTSLSWPERIEYDLDYVARRSVWLDVKVLAQTFALTLTGRADTNPPGDDEWAQE